MFQLIVFIIFLLSTLGVAFIIYKKIPVLVELPQNGHHGIKKPELILSVEERLKDFYFHFFKKQILWQKILSFTKVWVLKIENRIDILLHGARKKTQEVVKETKRKRKI